MELNYKMWGSGPTIVILHGLFGSLDNWSTIARSLAQQYTVFVVDLRNHGKSFHHPEFNYDVMSRDVLDWSEKMQLEDYVIVGHSMGGKVAMHLALNHVQVLRKLVVVDIGPKAYPVHHQTLIDGMFALDMNNISSRQQADEQLKPWVSEFGVRQFLLKNLKRSENGGFEWKINLPVIASQIEAVGAALPSGEIDLPTLFMSGARSSYIVPEDIVFIKEQFPQAIFETVPEAGHWVHAESPKSFLSMLLDYIQS